MDNIAPIVICPADVVINCEDPSLPVATGTATATDNCDAAPVVTFADVTTPGSCAGNYVITRMWIATDNCGNFSTCAQSITVQDITAPVITCPADITVNCEDPSLPASTGTATATDNCDASPVVTFVDLTTPGSCAGNYVITRTWTAADNCGNFNTCVQNITVQDITAPVITCPADITVNCEDPLVPASTGTATATDNCDAAPVVTFVDVTTPGSCPGNYVITRTWTATDYCGNFSTCAQNITVHDITAPVITCPADITVNCEDPSIPASTGIATATDNCDAAPVVTFADATTPGTCPGNYIITRTWTATDNCGNFSTCPQTITVHDITAPVITCPADITVNCEDSSVPASTGTATATDNCDAAPVVTFVDVTTPGSCAGNYVITRIWTATDNCGNFSTCAQAITVHDITSPVITCPADITANCEDPSPVATGTATATDNCDTAPVVTFADVITPGSCAGNYLILRTWTATDNCGNFSTCAQTVTVQDITIPIITCPADVVINCEDSSVPASTGTATATDNCDAAPVVTFVDVITSGSCAGNYVITRAWTATDNCGNFSNCIQTITVQDITVPVITCPADVVINCEDPSIPASTGTATATDNCDAAPVVMFADVTTPGSCTGNYVITRTWTATDNCGNFSTCPQSITVQDITAPVITCPVNVVINCEDPSLPAATGTATATDNCDAAPIVTFADVTIPGSCAGNYVITRTWMATDYCGNFSTCIQDITVQDITAPVITCPADVVINCEDPSVPASTGTATATDNCDTAPVVPFADLITPGSCAGNYVITRTWTATDYCGNFSSCVQIITVQDITAPVITCPANITVNCEDPSVPASTGIATAIDNCDAAPVVTFADITTPGSCAGNYVITRTWTATDNCGNFSTCAQTITVQDITAPVITCPADITVNCEDPSLPAATGTATATDNCDAAPVVTFADVTTPGFCAGNYVITRTWTATDNCGNFSTCAQSITVQDITAPVITCPADVVINCEDPSVPASTGTATATDNCDAAPVITFADVFTPGSCAGNYLITRTWTSTDFCGNFSTCAQTITVQDITAPVITCPADITLNCEDPSVPASTGIATATDNCDAAPVVTSADMTTPGSCAGNYIISRTWTATDNCGNFNTCIQSITVQDITAPVITCPVDVLINCEDPSLPVATGIATASDNCDAAPVVTFADVTTPGSCPGNYVITRTWTATDYCGNFSTCVQTITVQDITAPMITCPADITVNCEDPSNPASIGTATATDNCDAAPVVTFADVITPGTCPGNYIITRTWTATDNCGNFSNCPQTITVQDITAPVITCPADITVNCEDPSLPVATGTATATDNCDAAPVMTFADATTPGSCTGNYMITRTWTATDNCGNFSNCAQTITVQDTTAPVITCPADITVNCEDPSVPASTGTATATDNCDAAPVVTFADVTTPGSCVSNYVITRSWTATDYCGNFSTCAQTITIQDITAPVIICPADVVINCEDPSVPASTGFATATDNCDAAPVITFTDVTTPGSCAGNYVITRTWTAMDNCGNFSNCAQTITVQDITAPVITACSPDVTMSVNTNCEIFVPDFTSTILATDNCGIDTITQVPIAGTMYSPVHFGDTITVTVTVTDFCNNSTSCFTHLIVANNLPVAMDDSTSTNEDTPVLIPVLVNDNFNCDGPSTGSISVATPPTNGIAVVDDGGTPNDPTDDQILYSPNLNFNGTDTFTYTICDSDGDCSTALVTITIIAVNDPPVTFNETIQLCQGSSYSGNILIGDFDPDGTALFVVTTPVAGPANGIITIDAAGNYTYTPNAAYFGTDEVVFSICDAGIPGVECTNDTIFITVDEFVAANAGADQNHCDVTSTILTGNNPSPGTGNWILISGPNTPGIAPANSPIVIVNGMIPSAIPYVFEYTITNGTCSSSDTVVVMNYELPTIAFAGNDQDFCAQVPASTNMTANTPVIGTGNWTQLSGPVIAVYADPTDPLTLISGLAEGTYVF
ncbi:MAG: Ig-like domain-containing protein, partial [Bacteroidota bacterium]